MPLYVWEKYNAVSKYQQVETPGGTAPITLNANYSNSISFDEETGMFALNNPTAPGPLTDVGYTVNYTYLSDSAATHDVVYKRTQRPAWTVTAKSGYLITYVPASGSYVTLTSAIIHEKGSYVEDVYSSAQSAYPQNGIQDGYWYVFKETIPDVPSITVPGASMTGQQVSATWGGVDGVTSYKLERQVNGSGAWEQVYEGANLTYTDTAQTGWTSVQYRVSAGIGTVYGTPLESNTVDIIPASALVISGADGSLGTITAPVTYSVTSDTGNQITVEETVGNHTRTLTPTSGQLISIPVSMIDPAADGSGQIVIKASVQASSGRVTQTRNWTYTKTPLALPTKAYRVEQLQGGAKDVMPLTLAEAVMMPNGESVAGMLGGGFAHPTVQGRYSGNGEETRTIQYDLKPAFIIIFGSGGGDADAISFVASSFNGNTAWIDINASKWCSTEWGDYSVTLGAGGDCPNKSGQLYCYLLVY